MLLQLYQNQTSLVCFHGESMRVFIQSYGLSPSQRHNKASVSKEVKSKTKEDRMKAYDQHMSVQFHWKHLSMKLF